LLPFSHTPGEGRLLAQTLTNVLGPSYEQGIHFIGFSLGTLVNAAAANYLHNTTAGAFDWRRTQMTLLDNAELVNTAGRLLVYGYQEAGFLSGSWNPPTASMGARQKSEGRMKKGENRTWANQDPITSYSTAG
jgi:hypothetical protein